MPERQQGNVVIKRNRLLLLAGVIGIYLGNTGAEKLIDWFKRDFYASPMGALATAILFVWTGLMLAIGAFTLAAGSKRVLLSPEGVQCRRLFLCHRLSWDQIQQWGIISDHRLPWEGKVRHLYFTTGNAAEKPSKRTIRIFVMHRYLEQFQDIAVSYCREQSGMPPTGEE